MKAIKTTGSAGKKYGHVPGHQYHDVDVTISRTRRGNWTVEILETWGSAQGYDEEHGRKKVIGRGDELGAAVRDARDRACDAGIGDDCAAGRSYMAQALSEAESEAAEEVEAADAVPVNEAKQLAERGGLTVYGQAHDGSVWISGLERWMTADQVRAELARRADDMSMATQRSITDGTPLCRAS